MLSSGRLFIKKLMAFAIFGPRDSLIYVIKSYQEHQLSISMYNNYDSEESEDHENFTDKQCIVNERSL